MPFRHVYEASKLYINETKTVSIPECFRACTVACISVFAQVEPSPNECCIGNWFDLMSLRQIGIPCRPAWI